MSDCCRFIDGPVCSVGVAEPYPQYHQEMLRCDQVSKNDYRLLKG